MNYMLLFFQMLNKSYISGIKLTWSRGDQVDGVVLSTGVGFAR